MTDATETRVMDPLVYISVLNWNSYEKTLKCLSSIEKVRYGNYVVGVVDNGSADDSVEKITLAFPKVGLIRSEENLGFAGGHSLAVKAARNQGAKLIWIVNNDLVVHENALFRLVESYRKHGDGLYGSVPVEYPESSDLTDQRVDFPWKFFNVKYREHFFVLRPYRRYGELFPNGQDREVAALSGCSMLIPLSVIDKHGFMDSSYFLYAEEIDYCFRMESLGIPSFMVPSSLVRHESGGSTSQDPQLKAIAIYYAVRNQLLRIRRYQGFWTGLRAVIKDVFLAVFYLVSRGHSVSSSWHTLLGVRDGLYGRRGKTLSPERVFRK